MAFSAASTARYLSRYLRKCQLTDATQRPSPPRGEDPRRALAGGLRRAVRLLRRRARAAEAVAAGAAGVDAHEVEVLVEVHRDRRPAGLHPGRLVGGVTVGVGLDADDRAARHLLLGNRCHFRQSVAGEGRLVRALAAPRPAA